MLEDTAGRVLGRVQDQEPGAGRDLAGKLINVEAKAVLFPEGERNWCRTDEADHRLVDREARIRVDHLIALLRQGQDGEEHDGLPARRYHNLLRAEGQAALAAREACDALPQLADARRWRVMGFAGAECRDPGLDDMGGRIEVWLANLQVNDIDPAFLEGACPGEDFEGSLGSEASHPLGKLHLPGLPISADFLARWPPRAGEAWCCLSPIRWSVARSPPL